MLEIKGQVLHRVRLHVKVPGLLLNLNALLTKKLPKFLSRLEIQYKMQTADCRLGLKCRLGTKCRLQSGFKMQTEP